MTRTIGAGEIRGGDKVFVKETDGTFFVVRDGERIEGDGVYPGFPADLYLDLPDYSLPIADERLAGIPVVR